jgi:hypothetical protein
MRKQYINMDPVIWYSCPHCGVRQSVSYWDIKASEESRKEGTHITECCECEEEVELVPLG